MRRVTSWAGTLAVAIVAMAIGAAIGGAATGARMAADAAPPLEAARAPEPSETLRPPPQMHSAFGRVVAVRDPFIRVRTPEGDIVRVRVQPQTVIRRANKKVEVDAIARGDRVLAVGRVNQNGVLVARGILVQPMPAQAVDENDVPPPEPAGEPPAAPLGPAAPRPQPVPPPGSDAEPQPKPLRPRLPGAEPLRPLPAGEGNSAAPLARPELHDTGRE